MVKYYSYSRLSLEKRKLTSLKSSPKC